MGVDAMNGHAVQATKSTLPSRGNILKNITLLSISFLCQFTSYNGLERLQSSLNVEAGLGVITNSVIYASLLISCLFVPPLLIKVLGHKWTLVACSLPYILYIPANGYAHWGTMLPTGMLLGLCAGPLWTAQSSYFTLMAADYARVTKKNKGTIVAQFFGVFYFVYQFSNITTSVITSTILQLEPTNESLHAMSHGNISQYCGRNDCPRKSMEQTMIKDPEKSLVWTLLGVYGAISLVVLLVIPFFVDRLPAHHSREKKKINAKKTLFATVGHLKNKQQLMIIPLTIYSGLATALFAADFMKSFVSCPYGMWNVGWVALPFAVMNSLMSATSGLLVKCFGRIPLFTAGLIIDFSNQMTLLQWSPNAEEKYVVFILSGMFGVTDSIWNTQIFGLSGTLFTSNTEAAFANVLLWRSTGMIFGYAYSSLLCTSAKLYIAACVLVVGIIGYYITEYMESKKKNEHNFYGSTPININESPVGDKDDAAALSEPLETDPL